MPDLTDYEALDNAPVVFGLRAQGKLPTIEKMLSDGASWDEIGKAIGWCPKTAQEHWQRAAVAELAALRAQLANAPRTTGCGFHPETNELLHATLEWQGKTYEFVPGQVAAMRAQLTAERAARERLVAEWRAEASGYRKSGKWYGEAAAIVFCGLADQLAALDAPAVPSEPTKEPSE